MLGQPSGVIVGAVAAGLGVALVGVTVYLADTTVPPGAPPDTPSVPRPVFVLDTPAYTQDPGQGAFADADSMEIGSLTLRAADYFGMPPALLDAVVARELEIHRDGEQHLAPLDRRMLDAIDRPEDQETRIALEALVSYLGRDPRPLDSQLCQHPGLGIPVRAAFLHSQRLAYASHLEAIGLRPSGEMTWLLAGMSVLRDDREIMICIEEALRLGPRRVGLAFAEVAPTINLFRNDRLVLRAFLREWDEPEAARRRESLRDAALALAPAVVQPRP